MTNTPTYHRISYPPAGLQGRPCHGFVRREFRAFVIWTRVIRNHGTEVRQTQNRWERSGTTSGSRLSGTERQLSAS